MLRLLRAIVHSNCWIALGAPALIAVSSIEFGTPYPWALGVASFFFVLLSYNLQRWMRWVRRGAGSRGREAAVLSPKSYFFLSLFAALAASTALFYLERATLLRLLPLALLSLFYAYPLFGRGRGLRELPYIKLFLIAFSWAFLTVPVAAGECDVEMKEEEWLLFLERALFMAAITIPFDIRDLPYDDPAERSFPQLFGIRASKGVALLFLVTFLAIALWRSSADPVRIAAYGVTALLSAVLITGSGPPRGQLYYGGLLDGTMLFQFLALRAFQELPL